MLKSVLPVVVFALKVHFSKGLEVESPPEISFQTVDPTNQVAASLSSKISAAREILGAREARVAESDNNAARVRNPCTRPFAHFHGFPDASIGFQAALQSLQECRIGDQLQNVLNSEFFSMEKDVIVEAPMERSLLLVRGALGLGNSFVGDLIGSEGLLGGGALAALGPRIDGGPLGFGVAPVAAPRTESEMQGVQQQYMVNYSRGPWNIQTGVQVGVMAQDLVGDTFFLPPSGVPTGIPATPGVQPPPPALQSPQDTFNRAANEAFTLAFPRGYSQGYTRGVMSSLPGTPDITLPALPAGNPDGYNEGIQVGWVQGIREGYTQGFNQARESVNNTTAQRTLTNASTSIQSTSLIQPISPFPANMASEAAAEELINHTKSSLESNMTEMSADEVVQATSVSTGPSSIQEIDGPPDQSQDISNAPKIRAFSGPPQSLIQSSSLPYSNEADITIGLTAGTDPVVDEEVAVEEPSTLENKESGEEDFWGSQWTTTPFIAIAGAIVASFVVSVAAMTVFKQQKKKSRGSDLHENPVSPPCSTVTSIHPAEGTGSDTAAHSRSIARVIQWQEQHEDTQDIPHKSDSIVPSPLACQASAYMTDPTMFDFAIYNPTAQMGSAPQSPSHASDHGSEPRCKLGEYQPTSCKSAGVWQESSKLKVQVNRNGW